jgi:ABC-type multidrug transport system permease subunit
VRRFLRSVGLTIAHEGRLLARDPVVLVMLLCAPVVIITVAGYSLGALYGDGGRTLVLPVVDEDHGPVAAAVIGALEREPSIRVERVAARDTARALIRDGGSAPVAVVVAAETSAALTSGRDVPLALYVDPARRLQVNAIELRLAAVCRRAAMVARARAARGVRRAAHTLDRRLARLAASVERETRRLDAGIAQARAEAATALRTRLGAARRATETGMREREQAARATLEHEIAERRAALEMLGARARELDDARAAFEAWLGALRAAAGTRANAIPPPPPFPAALPPDVLAALTRPVALPSMPPLSLPELAEPPSPTVPRLDTAPLRAGLLALRDTPAPTLPGTLGLAERAAADGAPTVVNAFDQYVPGFGVTFLLIGMMLGIALTLFDERAWGTLARLQTSGVPVAGILLGKVLARVVVGVGQMLVLFAVGRALFGISLGPTPAALLLPTLAMAFAAAALGLVVPTIARAHDAVMPVGTMTSLALSAIGGCWWPLDFEPAWMQTIANWLPTTWTMRAYNDLMIRRLPAAVALRPFAATAAFGAVVLVAGVVLLTRSDA